jgi:hypothetical protein
MKARGEEEISCKKILRNKLWSGKKKNVLIYKHHKDEFCFFSVSFSASRNLIFYFSSSRVVNDFIESERKAVCVSAC